MNLRITQKVLSSELDDLLFQLPLDRPQPPKWRISPETPVNLPGELLKVMVARQSPDTMWRGALLAGQLDGSDSPATQWQRLTSGQVNSLKEMNTSSECLLKTKWVMDHQDPALSQS